jgi:hypothetical protein
MDAKVTVVTDVVVPLEFVTLKHLRTQSGEAVTVGCHQVPEVAMARILMALPGTRPKKLGELDADERAEQVADDPEEALRLASQAMQVAPEVIERGTFLLRADGTRIHPAFTWKEPAGESIPGMYLRDEDLMLMLEAILRIGGYIGGEAAEATFPGDAGGSGDSVGAVAPRTRKRKDTVGSVP